MLLVINHGNSARSVSQVLSYQQYQFYRADDKLGPSPLFLNFAISLAAAFEKLL